MIVNQGSLAIKPNLLIMGGTLEATALCIRLAELNVAATVSFAGRVDRPKRQPLPMRVGGFGGVQGLQKYLHSAKITHVVDATHPFAAQMSFNAARACAALGTPLIALARPAWDMQAGDTWQRVPDIDGAVTALGRPAARVLLAIGRMHLNAFAAQPQHHYVLRLVDPPKEALPFPNSTTLIDRGPFSVNGDLALMQQHRIDIVVSKNAGGKGAIAKIDAARILGLPVIMIDRPVMPARTEATNIEAVFDWLRAQGADLGV